VNHIFKPQPILDGYEKVSGRLAYLDDQVFENEAHAKLVYSTVPHARIVSIDTKAAQHVPGVIAIFHHANTPANAYNSTIWFEGQQEPEDEFMFPETVRFVGDRVAAVVAESQAAANRAAALIRIEYDERPAHIDAQTALAAALDPQGGDAGILIKEVRFDCGDSDAAFAAADLVVSDTVSTPRTHHCAIENHTCVAMPENDGRILVVSPCQSVFSVQMVTAKALGVGASQIRAIKAPIGGSFGGKAEPILEPLCAYFAKTLNRAVRLSLDRGETFASTRTRSGAIGRIRTAVNREGHILAREAETLSDAGAYATGGVFLPGSMLQRLCRLYRVPNVRFVGRAVRTNTVPSGAYRGYGSPQIHAISEINLDQTALALGMDPAEFRLKNLIDPYAKDPVSGYDVGNARARECVTEGVKRFGWHERRARTGGRGSSRRLRGVGMACANHINGCFPGYHEATTATLALRADGRIELTCALHDLGCGSNTVLAQIIAETLTVLPTDIVFAETDSDTCPYDLGTRASRMTYIAGEAVRRTAESLKARLKVAAALDLNCRAEDLVLDDGHVRNGRRSNRISFSALSRGASARGMDLEVTETYRAKTNPGSYAAHFTEVEVDTMTGMVKVLDYLAVHDLGRSINRQLVDGQIHGGVQMGIGYALFEDIGIDPVTGALKGTSLSRYHLVNAPEMPSIETLLIEMGEPTGPYGAKAVGEIATIPVAPAVVNAVNHALGLRMTTLPLTPGRIISALEQRVT